MKRREGGEAEQRGGYGVIKRRWQSGGVPRWRVMKARRRWSHPSLTRRRQWRDAWTLAPEAGHQAHTTHPFGHVASVRVVVMVLQDHHGGDDRHPHDDHDAGKVLT